MNSHAASAGNRLALSIEHPNKMKSGATMMLLTMIATNLAFYNFISAVAGATAEPELDKRTMHFNRASHVRRLAHL